MNGKNYLIKNLNLNLKLILQMERLIKGLMNAIMKVAIVLVILFIFIAGMAGIYSRIY